MLVRLGLCLDDALCEGIPGYPEGIDLGILIERGLNLAELDPISANLYLIVEAA